MSVLYGECGLLGIEVKRAAQVRSSDLAGLERFRQEYPEATCIVLYGGNRKYFDRFHFIPVAEALQSLEQIMKSGKVEI